MAIYGETVTLVNRTKKTLSARWDGRDETILPGENPGFPKVAVCNAKMQNPLMGSEDETNPTVSGCEYLVGVKAKPGEKQIDDISPIEQNERAVSRYVLEPVKKGQKLDVRVIKTNRASVATASGFEAD
jgi:hypothetical protein